MQRKKILHRVGRYRETDRPTSNRDCTTPLVQTIPYKLFVNITANRKKTEQQRRRRGTNEARNARKKNASQRQWVDG